MDLLVTAIFQVIGADFNAVAQRVVRQFEYLALIGFAIEGQGDDIIFLRIAVPASDADARFGINQQVLEGVGILFTLLLLWAHGRYRVNPVGAKEVIQLFVTWNLLLWGWMWVALP